ncbi:hypothetical protein E1A91_A10G176700v1 [Gossypium mustelinum]|uniref:DUF7950 domain-containing protein n=1 Tax=Gossypium mustelinum TaxID=34275 RepID=A0A5D2XMV2_GOSMU|nr:hypothetical protein E1A91_A10G176700v1 [Gossypium mustelinum]
MEGGNHWSMVKCSGGVYDKTIINRIMLKFRPIAPKPVNGDSDSSESILNSKNLDVTSKRKKRKYVRVCEKNNTRKKRILDRAREDNDGNKGFVTLQLMPEKADLNKSIVVERSWDVVDDDDLDRALGRDNYRFQDPPSLCLKLKTMVASDHVAVMGLPNPGSMTVVESWVMVESVTETCIEDGEMENCTDVEKMKNLEKDTCPGFVSDGLNRVFWVNQAYRNMVGLDQDGEQERAATAVGLVLKDGLTFPCGAFSCRVRLRYVDGKGKNYSKTVPCDIWKLSSGGFAWRLDVNAALSLGL